MHFISTQKKLTKTICDGGLANETLFAIIFKMYKEYEKDNSRILSVSSHIADWNRCSSTTSPHVFKEGNELDLKFIDEELERNFYACFIRKVSTEFPDKILKHYIYNYDREKNNRFILVEPFEMRCNKFFFMFNKSFYILSFILCCFMFIIFIL